MIRYYLFFINLILLSISSVAQASLKADASALSGRVMTTVQDTIGGVKTKIDTASQKFQESQLGSSVKSTIETYKALNEDVAKAATTVQDEYQETTDNFNDVKDEATDKYDEEMDNFNESQTGKVTELSKQLNEVNKKLEDRTEILSQELNSKRDAARNNLATLQQMYENTDDEEAKALLAQEMASLEEQISQYDTYAQQLEDENSDYLNSDEEYNDLMTQKQELTDQISALSGDAAQEATDSLINAFTGKTDEQRSAEYNKVIEENFLLPGEAQTAESVGRILKHRQEVLAKDTAHAFYTASALKLSLDGDLERLKRKQDNIAAVDYKITTVNLLVEQKIEDIKILYNYTNLILTDLRLKTSRNMFNQDYRLKNYDKDPASLNLDNYIFTKEDVPTDEGQKSFLDKVTGE